MGCLSVWRWPRDGANWMNNDSNNNNNNIYIYEVKQSCARIQPISLYIITHLDYKWTPNNGCAVQQHF